MDLSLQAGVLELGVLFLLVAMFALVVELEVVAQLLLDAQWACCGLLLRAVL